MEDALNFADAVLHITGAEIVKNSVCEVEMGQEIEAHRGDQDGRIGH